MNNRKSVATIQHPEFINLQSSDISPLMSKCDVKILYVGQNRNKSFITKQVATEMSKTLRGCPIIGHFIQEKQDFGDHGNQVVINGNGVKFEKLTKPYGFIAPNAKVWFQFFEDTDDFGNTVMREYLMAEGYLWTGQFEECARVLENNNPQSMELDEESLVGYWSKDENQGIEFFIINDAVFSTLCILGDDVEPCFEGASVSAPNISSQFSLDEKSVNDLIRMMRELQYALNNSEGGKPMHKPAQLEENKVSVQFEDAGGETSSDSEAITSAEGAEDGEGDPAEEIPATPEETQPENEETIPSVPPTTDESQITDVVLNDTDKDIIANAGDDYVPAVVEGVKPETVAEAVIKDGATNVPTNILQNAKAKDDEDEEKNKKSEDKEGQSNTDNSDNNTEENNSDDSESKDDDEDKKKKKNFSLEDFEALQTSYAALEAEVNDLRAFKQNIENEQKDELIASFYMLSDEDKKDVIANKANYSLREIKAELSMICVDKKINFAAETESSEPLTYNLNTHQADTTPAWLARVKEIHDARVNKL